MFMNRHTFHLGKIPAINVGLSLAKAFLVILLFYSGCLASLGTSFMPPLLLIFHMWAFFFYLFFVF